MLNACLNGEFDAPKQTFQVGLCSACQGRFWSTEANEVCNLSHQKLIRGTLPDDYGKVKQSLFANLRTVVLLNAAKVVCLSSEHIQYDDCLSGFCGLLLVLRKISIQNLKKLFHKKDYFRQ